jgi:hypothetical protein
VFFSRKEFNQLAVPVYDCMAICKWSGVCPTTVTGVDPEIVGEPGFDAEQDSTKDPAAPVGFSVIPAPPLLQC